MRKLILFSIIIVLFVVCAQRYSFEYGMLNSQVDNMTFSDSIIDIAFEITVNEIHFKLSNKTDWTMTIDWDKIALVQFNEAKRVMHSDVRYIERDQPQAPSVIPAHTNLTDLLFPVEKVTPLLNRWWVMPLFWPDKNHPATELKGQKFNLFFPIAIEDKLLEYNFSFIIKDVYPLKSTQPTTEETQSPKSRMPR